MTGAIDFAALIEPVARHLLGEPNGRLSSKTELRFGTNGSVSVEIAGEKKGQWCDFDPASSAIQNGGVLDLIARETGRKNGDGVKWLREHGFVGVEDAQKRQPRRAVAHYDYPNASGDLAFQVVRFEPKTFSQRRPDGNGRWINNLDGVEAVPYRLPELLKAASHATIFICEGEKDVDALRARDLVATTTPGGAGKWTPSMSAHLGGRNVVILPDNDEAGEAHARDLIKKLAGIAASIRVLQLPDLPRKGDVSDWLAAGGTADELVRLAAEASTVTPEAPANLLNLFCVHTWSALDIPPEPKLLGDLITPSTRAFLVGRTGLGKTHLAYGMGAGMASGRGFLHWRSERPSRWLIIDGEMPSALIKARAADLIRRAGPIPPGGLTIYSRDRAEAFAKLIPDLGEIEPLNTERGRLFVKKLVEIINPEGIIFDNVMSLIEGDQKDEVPWSQTLSLVTELTAAGIAQVYLDHTGHNSDRQYGSSTKAWRFDAVGIMTPLPEDQQQRGELAFTLSFDHPGKARRRTPDNWQDFEACTIRLVRDQWTSEPTTNNGGKAAQKVRPARMPFYEALIGAITKSSIGPGRTLQTTWELECMRRGLIEKGPKDGTKETWQQRSARYRDFRKAKSDLTAARLISVDDEVVIDLKGKWGA